MFRSPKSKVFVLQATMRCLRQITDEQQTASIFLSKENYETLDAELESNFNMDIDGLNNHTENDLKQTYQVRVVPPLRTITLKKIIRQYQLTNKQYSEPLYFGLGSPELEDYFQKHTERVIEKQSLTGYSSPKTHELEKTLEQLRYNRYSLTAEIARYMNLSPILIDKILRESKDTPERLVEMANQFRDIIYDIFIPVISNALYETVHELTSENAELTLLREPKNAEYYMFKAKPELTVKNDFEVIRPSDIQKSFHADTYCFDSKPEYELFMQYLKSSKTREIYFTGMFTADQGDLAIAYYDPDSRRLRHYYPDFVARMSDGTLQIIEVKGDNKINDPTVQAKAQATTELAIESGVDYKMYRGSDIMRTNVLEGESLPGFLNI
jgi:hypothetical protein